jgi:polyphosphate kinase
VTSIARRTSSRRATATAERASFPYLNRELSSIEFNRRVLFEAGDERNPLLERVKFLAIFASNMDEFFQIRVPGLMDQAAAETPPPPFERPAAEQLVAIRARYRELLAEQYEIFGRVSSALTAAGIAIVSYDDVRAHHAELRRHFLDNMYPILAPLTVGPSLPFPHVSPLSLSVGIRIKGPDEGRFGRVKVPSNLPRFVRIGKSQFLPIEQLIAANLDLLFTGMKVLETHVFRVTRDADLELQEEPSDLRLALENQLKQRRFGDAVRLELDSSMSAWMRDTLQQSIPIKAEDCYAVPGLIDHTALWEIAGLDRPELKLPPHQPVVPARLIPPDDDKPADVFAAMRAGDILVHHPYESFDASVQRFISQAASDPDVLSIKMTLYRTSGDSPIVRDLIAAAQRGTQVVVLVEIKARFDEQANIEWSHKLEEAGAHVVYGVANLKTHSKTAIVVRREEGGRLRLYGHIGTGNYNPGTARIYTDLGLLTCRPELGADLADLFNLLTSEGLEREFSRLIVAPMELRRWVMEMIRRETDNARAGRPARIVLKLNSLVDPDCIAALYEASQAGVKIDLIIRGMCSLWPGLPGVSEHIRVRSIVGRFLEHSRVLGFGNDGRMDWFIGSADLMERNLDRRVEAVVPIDDLEARDRIEKLIAVLLADDRRSWQLCPDGVYRRTEELNAAAGTIDTFETLAAQAMAAASRPIEPPPPGPGRRSFDPRV